MRVITAMGTPPSKLPTEGSKRATSASFFAREGNSRMTVPFPSTPEEEVKAVVTANAALDAEEPGASWIARVKSYVTTLLPSTVFFLNREADRVSV